MKLRLLAALTCLPTSLIAQLQMERWERISFEQGLSGQEIHSIYHDSRGFLWIGTSIGIERFDGYQFELFNDNPKRLQRLHGKSIAHIAESPDGYLFLQYEGNLQFIDFFHTDRLECQQVFLNPTTGIEGDVKALCMGRRGACFVLSTTAKGLSVWRMNAQHHFDAAFSLPCIIAGDEVFRLVQSKTGHFWLYGSRQGLFLIDEAGKVLQHVENKDFKVFQNAAPQAASGLPKVLEPGIFQEDKSERFWLSFKNVPGIFLGGQAGIGTQPWQGFPQNSYFTRMWEDERGNLLFKSPKPDDRITSKLLGLKANSETYDAGALLGVEDKILCIFGMDFERQVFLGTYSGIYKIFLKNTRIRHHLSRVLKPGGYGKVVRGIASDRQGNVFFALEHTNWCHFDTLTHRLDTLVLRDEKGKLLQFACGGSLAYDPAGYLWGASCADDVEGQLFRYEIDRKTTRTWRLNINLATFCLSRNGQICLLAVSDSTQGGNMGIFDPHTERYEPYTDADGANPLQNRTPQYIVESRTREGVFWIGTNNGLVVVDLQHRVSRAYGEGEKNDSLNFSNSNVLVVYEDEGGSLWLGTYGGGLNILHFEKGNTTDGFPRPHPIEVIDKKLGLCNDMVNGILPDGRGGYILSTQFGLSIFNPKDGMVDNCYQQDGLSHNEFNRFSFHQDANGRFYFGTINGLNDFRLEDLLQKTPGTNIQLTKLTKYFGGSDPVAEQLAGLNSLGELILEPEALYFQLEFMLTDYSEPLKNKFSYWLEGLSNDSIFLGETHSLRFNRLPPGRYTLHLHGADAKGNWTEKSLILPIWSKPFFYETWWFYSLLTLVVLGAVFAISQWRIRSIRKQEKWRTQMNQRFAELELKALQSQMNPHFIFNSLGAIQYFIQANRIQEADGFLTKFAQLMRLFLESSKNKYITLEEEIQLLKLYVEVEKMRFEGRFEVIFSVDKNIDTEEVEIPSMLLQPFVENAINHGLFHKKEKGLLHVRFSANGGGKIQCIVEDNGVGRDAAMALRAQSMKNYKSRALQIVHERLEALSHLEGYDVTIKVDDLRHPDGTAAGTKVTLTIPITD